MDYMNIRNNVLFFVKYCLKYKRKYYIILVYKIGKVGISVINVKSEIKPLKKVLLHRPGNELLNLTPDTLENLLFDDIPFLQVAQEEHDQFARILKDNGVEVVYLEDLMTETLDLNPELKEAFIKQFIYEAGVRTPKYRGLVYDF